MNNNVLGLDLKIDQEYIGKCVEQVVKAAMIEALDMKNKFAEECVKGILNIKVDSKGNPSSSSWDKDTLLEFHLRNAINEVTKEEINSILNEKKEQIRELIRKELTKKGTIDKFVNSFFINVSDTLANDWRTKIDINFERETQD